LNNGTASAATLVWASNTTSLNNDATVALGAITVGSKVTLQVQSDSTSLYQYQVTAAPTNKGTYTEIPVTWVQSGTGPAIANNASIFLAISVAGQTGPQGPPGPTGATGAAGAPGPAGPGVPAGGTTGQALEKTAGTDYATAWVTLPTSLPPSGSATNDLSGSYPGPSVAKVNGAALGTTTPLARGDLLVANATPALSRLALGTNGQVLQSNGTDAIGGASLGGPPSGAASGSLSGTYPGPSIAQSAVRGTPSSGGTAREIQKASIWAGDDLIDASIPLAKIAAGAFPLVVDATDATAVQLTGTSSLVKETTLTVTPGRLVMLTLRVGFRVLRQTGTGAPGINISTSTYQGGTAGTADGTLISSEPGGTIVLPTNGECVMSWYTFSTYLAAPSSLIRWKFFAWSSNTTDYQLHKWVVSLQIWQFA